MSEKPWAGRFNLPTDKFVEEIDSILSNKEKEVMSV